MTTITLMQIVAPQQLQSVDVSVYTSKSAPTATTTQIGRAVATNTTASAVVLTAGITAGGALAAATTLIPGRTIPPYSTDLCPELTGAVLPPGSQLHAYAGSASAITFTVSGIISQ